MAPNYGDRRRFFLATLLTLAALPALWWASRAEESAAPNVAVAGAGVGVDVGSAHGDSTTTATDDTPATADPAAAATLSATDAAPGAETFAATADPTVTTTTPVAVAAPDDAPGSQAPVYLAGPSSNVGAGLSRVAVPAKPTIERISTTATFRGSLGSRSCGIPGMVNNRTVTIVNLDNGRRVTCTTVLQRGELGDEVALATGLFSQLADLTDAPIPVEIRR